MEIDTIASIFVGISTLILASVSIMILRKTKDINERLLKIEEVRNVSKMQVVGNEVYFYDGNCYFRFDNCGGAPAFLEGLELEEYSSGTGLKGMNEDQKDMPNTSSIMPTTVFDLGFPVPAEIDGSDALLMTIRYRLVDDDRCIPSHVQFKLSLKEKRDGGLIIFNAEKKDDDLLASVQEEMEKRK